MTRRTSAHSDRSGRRLRSGGFTLVELLVVIGIIIVLAGILLPMGMRAMTKADRARVASELNAIASALEAYKQDFGSYPVPAYEPVFGAQTTTLPISVALPPQRPNPPTGAQLLCQALIGPAPMTDTGAGTQRPIQDGVEGPGFRVKRFPNPTGGINTKTDNLNSKSYPPYLDVSQFKIGDGIDDSNAKARLADPTKYGLTYTILDRFRKPIHYYPAHGNPNITLGAGTVGGYVGLRADHPRYCVDDNPYSTTVTPGDAAMNIEKMRLFLGDLNKNGRIDGTETAAFTGPYILWSPGPDETYGPVAGDGGSTTAYDAPDLKTCDDITNFGG